MFSTKSILHDAYPVTSNTTRRGVLTFAAKAIPLTSSSCQVLLINFLTIQETPAFWIYLFNIFCVIGLFLASITAHLHRMDIPMA
jgi:hypothetical protein